MTEHDAGGFEAGFARGMLLGTIAGSALAWLLFVVYLWLKFA